jgi:hypothetical protein
MVTYPKGDEMKEFTAESYTFAQEDRTIVDIHSITITSTLYLGAATDHVHELHPADTKRISFFVEGPKIEGSILWAVANDLSSGFSLENIRHEGYSEYSADTIIFCKLEKRKTNDI